MSTAMIHVRVDEAIKDQASAALGAMGLTLSEAVRVFLSRVAAEQAIPFELKVPNAATRAAMDEAQAIITARHHTADDLFDALAKEAK